MSNDENPYRSPHAEQSHAASREQPVELETGSASDEASHSMTKLTSFLTIAEAQLCQAVLNQRGIESYLEDEGSVGVNWLWSNAVGGVKVLVASEDLQAAKEVLASAEVTSEKGEDSPEVTFDCEECGKEITFPGDRRGKVETCPKCHEYVDVPD